MEKFLIALVVIGFFALAFLPPVFFLLISGHLGDKYLEDTWESSSSVVSSYGSPCPGAMSIGPGEDGKTLYQTYSLKKVSGEQRGKNIGMLVSAIYLILFMIVSSTMDGNHYLELNPRKWLDDI